MYLSEIFPGLAISGFEAEGFFELALRLIEPVLFREQDTVIKMCPRVVGIQPRRLTKFISCRVQLIGRIQFAGFSLMAAR